MFVNRNLELLFKELKSLPPYNMCLIIFLNSTVGFALKICMVKISYDILLRIYGCDWPCFNKIIIKLILFKNKQIILKEILNRDSFEHLL